MSKIINKPLKKEQKIRKAIFKGSPNLFTTADLNRQIEMLTERIDTLHNMMSNGIVADIQIKFDSNGYVVVEYSYVEVYGCVLYSGAVQSLTTTHVNTFEGLAVWYITQNVTYADDATHLISGAKFEDGTSKKAADHEVISEWGITFCEGGEWSDGHTGNVNRLELLRVTQVTGDTLKYTPFWTPLESSPFSAILTDLKEKCTALEETLRTKKVSIPTLSSAVITRPTQGDSDFEGKAWMSLNAQTFSVVVDCSITAETAQGTMSFFIPLSNYFTDNEISWMGEEHYKAKMGISDISSGVSLKLSLYESVQTSQGGGDLNAIPIGKYLAIDVAFDGASMGDLFSLSTNLVIMR